MVFNDNKVVSQVIESIIFKLHALFLNTQNIGLTLYPIITPFGASEISCI